MQAKKTGNCKKDVFVPILFLYLEKHLYKILIYNMLLYIKITFTRFRKARNKANAFLYVGANTFYARWAQRKIDCYAPVISP